MILFVFLIREAWMDDLEAVFAPSRTAVLLKHLSEVPIRSMWRTLPEWEREKRAALPLIHSPC